MKITLKNIVHGKMALRVFVLRTAADHRTGNGFNENYIAN